MSMVRPNLLLIVLSLVLSLVLSFVSVFPSTARASEISIDLNDFFAEPTVTVAADGSSASFEEDPIFSSVLLSNDPGSGEPEVIVPAPGRSLIFSYEFAEGAGEDDSFLAFILDAATGVSLGSAFEFMTDFSSSGMVAFEIGSLVGTTLGLQFELISSDAGPNQGLGDTTLLVSNVRLSDASIVPEPGTGWLCLAGVLGLVARRRASARPPSKPPQ